jgi:hypothetical protein
VASETSRHMNVAVDWSPHEYVPGSRRALEGYIADMRSLTG